MGIRQQVDRNLLLCLPRLTVLVTIDILPILPPLGH
jgi:hypothetical protein